MKDVRAKGEIKEDREPKINKEKVKQKETEKTISKRKGTCRRKNVDGKRKTMREEKKIGTRN